MSDSDPTLVLSEAKDALARHDHRTATRLGRELLARNRSDFDALMLMADIAGAAGRISEEIDFISSAVRVQPRNARLRAHLGLRFVVTASYPKALAQFEKALKLEPGLSSALVGRSQVYERQDRYDKARATLAPLVRNGVATPEVAAGLLRILVHDGDLQEATTLGERVLAAANGENLPLRSMCFTLAAAYERLGDYDRAFESAQRGQSMLTVPFDLDAHTRSIDALIDVFTEERVRALPRAVETSPVPMFIVGMPRTGSTLLERIIHSHPNAHGADEIDALHRVVNELVTDLDSPHGYPKCIQYLDQEKVDTHGRSYLHELLKLAPGAQRITNKHLGNFVYLGLITALLPGARVIHCRRDALDTCLSCFMSRLTPAQSPFAADLRDLGGYYRQYQRLMDHWREVIDLELLEVDYEELITDQEAVTRRIIEFCGLPWDDACLRFHETVRHDRTLSFDQVRRPLYATSVGRAERFGARLDPLREALGLDAPVGRREDGEP